MPTSHTPLKTAGVFDPVRDNRMDWLWAWDNRRQLAYVKEAVLDKIEGAFYDYLGDSGWPSPVSDWVLAMGIQGGAASYQWNDSSDVDVMVVLDWLKLFEEMGKWNRAQFEAVDLADQYDYLQRPGGRLSGKDVKRRLEQCISGRGIWQGKGIRNKAVLKSIAPSHPIDYSLQRGLHHGDLRFDGQPPIVDASNLSSYLVDLPVKRQRDEHGRSKQDTTWLNEIQKPPTGFSLERDAPELYQKGLGQLRYVTMAFDFLYEPDSAKDLLKGMTVLSERFREFMGARTEGYRAWAKNPGLYTVEVDGVTYGHPDWFPNNVGVKLLESTGPKDGKKLVKEILRNKNWSDRRYVQRNFQQVANEIKAFIEPNYIAIRKLFAAKHTGRPFRFKNPRVAKVAYGSNVDTTPPRWLKEVEAHFQKKFKKASFHIESSNMMGSVVLHILKAGKLRLAQVQISGWKGDPKSYSVVAYGKPSLHSMRISRGSDPTAKDVISHIEITLTDETIAKLRGSRGKPPQEEMNTVYGQIQAAKRLMIKALPGGKIQWVSQGDILQGDYRLKGSVDLDGDGEFSGGYRNEIKVLEVAVDWDDREFTLYTFGESEKTKTSRGFITLIDRYLERMMRKGLKNLDPFVKDMILGKVRPEDFIRAITDSKVSYEYVDGKSLDSEMAVTLRKRTKQKIPDRMVRDWVKQNWRQVISTFPNKNPPTYGEIHGTYERRDQEMRDLKFPDVRYARFEDVVYSGVRQDPNSLDVEWHGSIAVPYRNDHYNDYDDSEDLYDDEY